jgi:hypothetical protein
MVENSMGKVSDLARLKYRMCIGGRQHRDLLLSLGTIMFKPKGIVMGVPFNISFCLFAILSMTTRSFLLKKNLNPYSIFFVIILTASVLSCTLEPPLFILFSVRF